MWLLLILIGIAMILFGVFVQAAKFLIWIGIAIAVISIILWVIRAVGRAGRGAL